MSLLFEDAAKAKSAIMASQQKEIAKLYDDWANDIAERAKFYSHKTNASAPLSERYYKELYKQMKATSQVVGDEIAGLIKTNMYTIADSVVADNVKWLQSFGFSPDGLNAAFSHVPNDVVQMLVTGQVYQGGWNLSQRIWSDNQQTQKDIYQIMARGLAEQKSVFSIAKDLESYVRPGAAKPWNPILAMKNTKTGEIEYKRIYKKQVDYNAQRLARTLAQHTYQQSFIATTKNNPFITEYIWHSNGSRVCELCKARDGAHFKKDELPMDHPNGMCVMEPVVAKDMNDKLVDWFNSPDGTYPEIDAFAGNFGYEAKTTGTVQDFINKYGTSTKSPSAWYNGLTPAQKAEAKALKDASGLTWNDWYNQNIYEGSKAAQAAVSTVTNVTNMPNNVDEALKKHLKELGFKESQMPWNYSSFDDWYYNSNADLNALLKLSKEQGGKGINSKLLEKFYNEAVSSHTMVNAATTAAKTAATKATTSAAAKAVSVANKADDAIALAFKNKYSESEITDLIYKAYYSPDNSKAISAVEEFLKANGVTDFTKYQDKWGEYDPSKFIDVVSSFYSKYTTNTTTIGNTFDAATWRKSMSENNLTEINNWTKDWLAAISPSEKRGVVTYTGSAYWDMNAYLRGQQSSTSYKKAIEECKSALSKASLPKEMVVRRGADFNMLDTLGIGKVTPQNKNNVIGAIVQDKGFMSTSPAPQGGFTYMNIEYVIKLPQGTQAMYVDSISKHKGEQELLINCGGKFMVEDVEFGNNGNVKRIYMTLTNLQNK